MKSIINNLKFAAKINQSKCDNLKLADKKIEVDENKH